MSNYDTKQVNFFKISKKLLRNDIFKHSTPNVKIIVIYLISLSESFGKPIFWQKPINFCEEININQATLYRAKNQLLLLGIQIKSENKLWVFDMTKFLSNFTEYKEILKSLQNV